MKKYVFVDKMELHLAQIHKSARTVLVCNAFKLIKMMKLASQMQIIVYQNLFNYL